MARLSRLCTIAMGKSKSDLQATAFCGVDIPQQLADAGARTGQPVLMRVAQANKTGSPVVLRTIHPLTDGSILIGSQPQATTFCPCRQVHM